MQASPPPPDQRSQCRICRAVIAAGLKFCAVCGAQVNEMTAEELRGVVYVLTELARWEAQGLVSSEQAAALRRTYERRREELRARLEHGVDDRKPAPPLPIKTGAPEPGARATGAGAQHGQRAEATATTAPDYAVAAAFSKFISSRSQFRLPLIHKPRRTFIETLSDPNTLRLMLYTGAAMLVVGIVIWLRDVLYLKLQEPVVQAALLAFGTCAVTASGWYTILRTRQRLTGRALTLIGSVLVPVNFWFLVRSGLISNNGRAWVVCAFCALLYTHTAALLRERLYVYLACVASVATAWALVYRADSDAFGLYALTTMAASLVFLHLSRLFPLDRDVHEGGATESSGSGGDSMNEDGATAMSRFSYRLWGPPLVRSALAGTALCALFYMPLRLWPSPSLYDGIFRLRANDYDPSIAMLLFAAAAYVLWFTGRYIYTDRRVFLYALSALALFWTELLALDGFRLSGSTNFLALTITTLVITITARLAADDEASRALHRASALLAVTLALAAFAILLAPSVYTMRDSAALACLAVSFALLSTPRLTARVAGAAFAHAAALFASLSFLIALLSASIQSDTLFVAACAAWPFALYAGAWLARSRRIEAQLAGPFMRLADAEFVLLLLWASILALLLHDLADTALQSRRPSMFCALSAAVLYGALRGARERSAFGALMASVGALVLVAASLDALKMAGMWPASWPIAAGLISAAFLMRKASARWLKPNGEQIDSTGARPLEGVVRLVTDIAVLACALLWFLSAIYSADSGGFGAACVLLLALLYWTESAARSRLPLAAHLMAAHAGAFFLTLLIALRVDARWFAALAALILFPVFFALGRSAAVGRDWIARPMSRAAIVTASLAFVGALLDAAQHLQVGDPLLLAPCITVGAIALTSFGASLFSMGETRVRYFRAGLMASAISFALACLRAGYDPLSDVEIYTSPVAILLLVIAYLSFRRRWEEYDSDTSLLLWTGSLVLCVPLLFHALYFRLLLDVPAPWRDLGTLCASLALILFGVTVRLRAPVIVGVIVLTIELLALVVTSVNWLQVPVRNYLITVGALILIVVWAFEYRREQIMLARKRFNERRDYARERFGEWR